MTRDKSRKVVRAKRSPVNPRQWHVELDCRHTRWVTTAGKEPKTAACHKCVDKEEGSE